MSNIAIKAENISKAYQLGEFSTGTLSRDIERAWARLRGKEDPFLMIGETNDRTKKSESNIVWSLKDINFEIEKGDTVGIIGRNGAGKSTLLKILSRVTSPTTGEITGIGRIASLLEVGTGFHPELTGRENIYLNGAILGMRKAEIKRQFDQIVDFSGVERYIDTPVKRYSSGMYVRLAFAVAAHLESEILIVDEVLAVGDAEFQKKCLGKMSEVSKGQGKTVLFVSHNMNAVSILCKKGIFLKNGILDFSGSVSECINIYNKHDFANVLKSLWVNTNNQFYDESFFIKKVALTDENFNPIAERTLNSDEILNIIFEGEVVEFNSALKIGYELLDGDGNLIFSSLSTDQNQANWIGLNKGLNKVVSSIPIKLLKPGNYVVSIHVSLHHQKWICNARQQDIRLNFNVINSYYESPYWMQDSGLIKVIVPYYLIS
jgi:lipopolysaccharide transport system ATP-binding protein